MVKLQKRKAMSQSMEIALIVGVVIAIVGVVAFSVTGGVQSLTQRASVSIAHSEFTKTFNGTYYLTADVKNDGNKKLTNLTVQVQDSVPYALAPLPLLPGQTASYSGKVIPLPANPVSGTQLPMTVKAISDDGSVTSKTGSLFAP
ncbi:MAG: hypothetical protein ACREA8_00490 [Nitrosotalea sp.]